MTVRTRLGLILAVAVVAVIAAVTTWHVTSQPTVAVADAPPPPQVPDAPSAGTPVCGQPVLDSPWHYDGPPGTFTTSGRPSGLPTFGAAGTDFPNARKVVVIPAGDNTAAAANSQYRIPHAVLYFEPGMHRIRDGMFTSPDSAYVGGRTERAGKAIINGVGGATNGTGRGGTSLNAAPGGVTLHNQTWEYLTIENYSSAEDTTAVMGEAANGDVYKYLTIGPNEYGGQPGSGVPPKTGEASGGGYAVDLGSNATVEYDCITHNAQGGFNGQGLDITIAHNEISWNGLGIYPDCASGPGCNPRSDGNGGGGKLFYSLNTSIVHNYVHNNYDAGIWMDTNNSGTRITSNYISSNYAVGIIDEASYNADISGNTLIGNGWASDGPWPAGIGGKPCTSSGISCTNGFGPILGGGGGFPYSTIYIPNSGGNRNLNTVRIPRSIPAPGCSSDCTVKSRYSGHFLVEGNVLRNNFGGITVYNDNNRYPGSLNDDSSCWLPLGTLGQPNSRTYGYQSKVLVTGTDTTVSGRSVTTTGGTHAICMNYGHNSGADATGHYDSAASPPDRNRAPSVGMAVYNQNSGAFLGNVASVTNANSFILSDSPGNEKGAALVLSAYGGCGPASYYQGALNTRSGNPRAYYWDNCIFGARNVTVSGNKLSMDANRVTGCTVTNMCGFSGAFAFTPGVTKSQQYWQSYEELIANASGGVGNVFSDNAYSWSGGGEGSWQFEAATQGNHISSTQWQEVPYGQDSGSTFSG